ncbi:hypothetical protein NGM33_09020 [Nocardiopsis dassonvillei]|uniref:hypothetical protein n=1 Tax=Nocardiopsis dassonvillei TaxID=2014 RepID=UPI00102CB59B|nr:hypothetical protein [Nocardiopsis dassonvillei]MCP3013474.1 hypothetical protein [Nocardiopsis dassonvillei]
MHPSPPSGPGPGQPPYPQQPQHPHQGGYGYPQPQGPGGHPYGALGGPPPPPRFDGAPGNPDTMPGAATAVRVLMFIGGPIGILFGVLLGGMVLLGVGLGAAAGSSAEVSDPALTTALGLLSVVGGFVALIPLVYGIASTWLAAIMGRRKSGVYWGVVAFNIVASLILVAGIIGSVSMEEPPTALLQLAFHGTMTGLMFAPKVRAFYGV